MPADYVDSQQPNSGGRLGFPALEERHEVETCVIGGGLAGLSVALSLAERNCGVAVIEANRVGWGRPGETAASSRRVARGMDSMWTTELTKPERCLISRGRAWTGCGGHRGLRHRLRSGEIRHPHGLVVRSAQ